MLNPKQLSFSLASSYHQVTTPPLLPLNLAQRGNPDLGLPGRGLRATFLCQPWNWTGFAAAMLEQNLESQHSTCTM